MENKTDSLTTQPKKIYKKRGSPSTIDKISKEKIKKLALAGWTDAQIADLFGFTAKGFQDYRAKHQKFFLSLIDWKREADAKVERCLYQRAIGYKIREVHFERITLGGLPKQVDESHVEETKVEAFKTRVIEKEVAPDVTAQQFWLKNRQPDKWRENGLNRGNTETHVHLTNIKLSEKTSEELIGLLLGRNGFAKTEPARTP